MTGPVRLGVNVDHVATMRNARGGRASRPAARRRARDRGRRRRHHGASARGPPPHPRRRHRAADGAPRQTAQFRDGGDRRDDRDRAQAPAACRLPGAGAARRSAPPRAASTWSAATTRSPRWSNALRRAGIRVSLFIVADPAQIEAAAEIGAPVIEIHTGAWCDAVVGRRQGGGGGGIRPHRAGRRARRAARARGACGPRSRLRDRGGGLRAAGDRRAQYRPLPHGRGDLRRARRT